MHPILFKAGPVTIYFFGLFLVLALFSMTFVVWRQTRLRGLSEEKVFDILILTLISALTIGRLGYVFFHGNFFASDIGKIIFVTKYPGIDFLTSLMAGVVVAVLISAAQTISAWVILDIFAVGLAVAIVPGFLGCFLDGCLTGNPYLPLVLAVAGTVIYSFLRLIQNRLKQSVGLSRIERRPGLIFLAYLIFQMLSLLIVKARGGNDRALWYGGLALVFAIIFILKYPDIFGIWLNFLKTFLLRLRVILKLGGGNSKENSPS